MRYDSPDVGLGRQRNVPRGLQGRRIGVRNDEDARQSGIEGKPSVQNLPEEDRIEVGQEKFRPLSDKKAVLNDDETGGPKEQIDLVSISIDGDGGPSKLLERSLAVMAGVQLGIIVFAVAIQARPHQLCAFDLSWKADTLQHK